MMVYVVHGKPSPTSPTYVLGVFDDEDAALQAEQDALRDSAGEGGWSFTSVVARSLTTQHSYACTTPTLCTLRGDH